MNTPRFPRLQQGLSRIAQATRQALGRGAARGTEAGGEAAQRLWSARRGLADRKSTRLNSSHSQQSRMPSSA